MPTADVLMKAGGWSVNLLDGTPASIRDLFRLETVAGFGHIVITPTRVDDKAITFTNLLALSRYTGVYRGEKDGRRGITGPGPVTWLGDESSIGPLLGRASAAGGAGTNKDTSKPFTLTGQTFQASVGFLRPDSLAAGSVQAAGGSYTNSWTNTVIRTALDTVMDYFTCEYRVNPNLTLDAGSQQYLYPTTTDPTAVVQRKPGGRDANIAGVGAIKFDTGKDLDDYCTEVIADCGGTFGAATIYPSIPYYDAFGNLVRREKVVSLSNIGAGNENAAASAELNRHTSVRRLVRIGSDQYDIGADIKTGDTIYVWDPDHDLVDLANQLQYRGQDIYPLKMRVYGSTWPIRRGMGVYFRDGGGTITDLTDWFIPETSDVTLDVGAVLRVL